MAKKSSWKGKKQYPTYKTENRVYKNKIAKLEKHIKAYPEDEKAKEALERIKKSGYSGRQRPHAPGSNPTISLKPLFLPNRHLYPRTAGEQLAELLGIKLPKPRRKRKTRVKVKRRKNVKQTA